MQPHKKPTAWHDWSHAKERIGQQLQKYYQACPTEDLPPRLVALVKKLGEELPQDQ
jgi:hypothetical protein